MITLGISCYNQPDLIPIQQKEWARYPEEISVVLVDDCSTPPLPVRQLPRTVLYRITDDICWNYGARNLIIERSRTPWVLLTDADHILTAEWAEELLKTQLDNGCYYFFSRIDARGPSIRGHNNSYLINREQFKRIGWIDENYSGFYGYEDSDFRTRASRFVKKVTLDIPLVHHRARTPGLPRNSGRNKAKYLAERGRHLSQERLRFGWKRIF